MKVLLLAVAQCLSFSELALAQCAAKDHVYIDPSLVPHRPQISQDQMRGIMSDPRIPWEQKMQFQSLYLSQGQPVQMPMGNGYVLISPLNPCVQQFIPSR
jgi:hypothetical protein